MPLCDAPSSPVTPARSITKIDRQLVQRHVHEHLIEGPVQEGRVDRHDRPQPTHRQAGGGGNGVLLGDPDIEDAFGPALGEGASPTGSSIDAVMATTSSRRSRRCAASARRKLRSTMRPTAIETGRPVRGSLIPTLCIRS